MSLSIKDKYVVKKIESDLCKDFVLNMHYAGRIPPISFAYGMYEKDDLIGILTIGKPASNSLCVGVCGANYSKHVYELNRLCLKTLKEKNALSFFVSNVLKDLKSQNIILVSYADTGMSHIGYIYQATNWIYTGQTKSRTDKYTPPGKHSRHYTEEFNHLRKFRTSKHRYIYFCANKKKKKEFEKALKYPIEQYPKGNNEYYVLGEKMKAKIYNKETGEFYFE